VARKGKNLVATWQKTDSSDETNLVLMFVSNGKPCMLVLSDMPRTREFPKRDKVKPLASRLPIPKDKTRLEAAIKKLEGRLTGRCIDSQMLPQPQRPRLAKATSASSKRETVLAWYQEKEQRRKIRSVMKKWDTYYGNYVLRGLGLTSAPDLGYTKPKTQEETVTMLVSFEQEKIDYVLALRARRKGERDLRKLQERLEQLTAVTNGQTREE
jgi:hypothetical protein